MGFDGQLRQNLRAHSHERVGARGALGGLLGLEMSTMRGEPESS